MLYKGCRLKTLTSLARIHASCSSREREDATRVTTSMRIAMNDLKPEALYVAYPGLCRVRLAHRTEAVPL